MAYPSLESLTNGAVTGTGTLDIPTGFLGKFRLNADGTNTATLIIRDNDVTGAILIDISTQNTMSEAFPIKISSKKIYYTVTGLNADAQMYELRPRGFM